MSEKRKTQRFQDVNKAVINFSDENDHTIRGSNPASTLDLSIDGAMLVSQKSFPANTRLTISLNLPKSKQTVKLRARVVWARNSPKKGLHEIGVEFIHSIETLPVFFKHLYSHEVQSKELKDIFVSSEYMEERRKTQRFHEVNKTIINFVDKTHHTSRGSKLALTQDLSIDGAMLVSPESFPLDPKLSIFLELPKSKQTVKLQARVVWAHHSDGLHEIGVEFIHSSKTTPIFFKHLFGHGVR